jgi:hypothetical protein
LPNVSGKLENMVERRFRPGFRFSTLDFFVLILVGWTGADSAAVNFWPGIAILFVLAHFFLFCNIIRMARSSELVWAALFLTASTFTILVGAPVWPLTFGISFVATIALITLEARKPSYHGIYWRKLNPDLPRWWEEHAPQAAREKGSGGQSGTGTIASGGGRICR